MEALLPISAAVRPEAKSEKAATSVAGPNAHAPSILLPLRFMVTGILALFTGVLLLVLRPDILATYHYNQYVIATTHLFVLGWISTIVMGAMYQLVPVALETRLYSERLARWQFLCHFVGFSGMVWMFWTWNLKQVGHFGSVLAVGVALFAYNIGRTLARVPRWNVVATAVASALGWLALAVTAGLLVVIGKCDYDLDSALGAASPVGMLLRALSATAGLVHKFDAISTMHAHAHLGAVGVFITLIVGISYKLVPMFTLSEIQNRRRAAASLWLLNLGLAGAFVTILLRSSWKPVFALMVLAGLLCYGFELVAILRARKRRPLDWGMKYFLTALGLLVPLACLAAVLSWPSLPLTALSGQLENLYGFLAFAGVVSFAIIGMLYKILPFLAWYASYSKHIGRYKVPSLADLYSPRLQNAGYWTYLAGLGLTGIGILPGAALPIRCGCGLLLVSLLLLALNVGLVLSHLLRPKLEPLTLKPTLKANV
jgi:hypothetical protein